MSAKYFSTRTVSWHCLIIVLLASKSVALETASAQLPNWASHKDPSLANATNKMGVDIPSLTKHKSIGKWGPVLLMDTALIEIVSNANREGIPESMEKNLERYTKTSLFSSIGKRTEVLARLSTTVGDSGTPNTVRDNHGFSVKFYTEEGNWNFVGFHLPVFLIRDPMVQPSLLHVLKRNPQTHLYDPNMFWDFMSLRPETTLNILMVFSDLGIPASFRHMNGFGVHSFQLVNARGEIHFARFHWHTNQGLKNLTQAEAYKIAGENPDYSTQDLFDAIGRHEFPSWTLYIQVMTVAQARMHPFNPFDTTKILSEETFPLIPVGRLVLDRNSRNYFSEVESAAFCAGDLVPGIEMSEYDSMFHSRSFAYRDTQRHRLGPNFEQLPINAPNVFLGKRKR